MRLIPLLALALVAGPQAATLADLGADLARVEGLEGYTLDELMVLVGVAWGYNCSREGVVTLVDGTFDLGAI